MFAPFTVLSISSSTMCIRIFIILMFLLSVFGKTSALPYDDVVACEWPLQGRIVYGRDELYNLRIQASTFSAPPDFGIPKELRTRKRGRKGGIRARLRRRKFTPPLPSIIAGNARSLCNKLDELKSAASYMHEYRDCLICFSETWFQDVHTTTFSNIDGFHCERNDRSSESGKKSGGGVCM